jgi:DNA-binding transcriptional regulator/RsmH inhibitor MraZ
MKKRLSGEQKSRVSLSHGLIMKLRLEVLRALVGHIPPYPLWGELLWQRQEEIAKRMQAAQQTIP